MSPAEPASSEEHDRQSESISNSLRDLFEKTMESFAAGNLNTAMFQKVSDLRLNFEQALDIEQHRGAQYLVNTRLRPGSFELPQAYKPFEKVFAIRLLWSICKDVDQFEKYAHILATSLANAEMIHQKTQSKTTEVWPEIGKRKKNDEAEYLDQVYKKCRVLELLAKRYPLTVFEGNESVLPTLSNSQKAASLDERSLRKEVKTHEVKKLKTPKKRRTEQAKRELFPIQQKAFDGDGVHVGIVEKEFWNDFRGDLAKTYAIVLPTGAGKTIVAAEWVARWYQKTIEQALEDANEDLEPGEPPAVLFIAPQRVLAAQAAKEFHSYLAGQYDIKMRSHIGMDGKVVETNWAFIDQSMQHYKTAVMALDEEQCFIEQNSSLYGLPFAEIQDLLLSQWEDILQLSKYGIWSEDPQIAALQKLLHQQKILRSDEIEKSFVQAAHKVFFAMRDKTQRGVGKEKSNANTILGLMKQIDPSINNEQNAVIRAEILITREWDQILSPFKFEADNVELPVLRQIVNILKINIPSIYQGLFKLTLDCQNGMITKPDPKDYSNSHIDELNEKVMRAAMPLEAAFSTVQGLHSRKDGDFSKLEALLKKLSNDGKRRILVVCDEAHHYGSEAPKNIGVLNYLKSHPCVDRIIGITASDVRSNGEHIKEQFGQVVAKSTLLEAVSSGRLQQFTLVQPEIDVTDLDVGQVAEISGKKAEKAKERLLASIDNLAQRVTLIESVQRGEKAIEEIFPGLPTADQEAWTKGLEQQWSRNILGFCNDKASARFVAQELDQRGIRAATIFGETSGDERARIINDYKTGAIQAILLVNVGREGFDLPQTTIGVIFGSVGSPVTLQQMFGRFLRRRPGPPSLILDYSVPASQIWHAELLRRQFAVDVIGKQVTDRVKKDEAAAQKVIKDKNPGDVAVGNDLLNTLALLGDKHITFVHDTIHTVNAMQLLQIKAADAGSAEMGNFIEQSKADDKSAEKVEEESPLTEVSLEFIWPQTTDNLIEALQKKSVVTAELKTSSQADGTLLGYLDFSLQPGGDKIKITLRDFEPAPGFNMAKLEQLEKRLESAINNSKATNEIAKAWQTSARLKGERMALGSVFIDGETPVDVADFSVTGRKIDLEIRTDVADVQEILKVLGEALLSATIASDKKVTGFADINAECQEITSQNEIFSEKLVHELWSYFAKGHYQSQVLKTNVKETPMAIRIFNGTSKDHDTKRTTFHQFDAETESKLRFAFHTPIFDKVRSNLDTQLQDVLRKSKKWKILDNIGSTFVVESVSTNPVIFEVVLEEAETGVWNIPDHIVSGFSITRNKSASFSDYTSFKNENELKQLMEIAQEIISHVIGENIGDEKLSFSLTQDGSLEPKHIQSNK